MTPGRHRPLASSALADWVIGTLVFCGCLVFTAQPASGLERTIRSRIANYEQAPVTVLKGSTRLVETYHAANQFPLVTDGDGREVPVHRTRVRYLNRMNQQVPAYLIEGTLELRNHTRKKISAIQITTIFLNAFHERISTARQSITREIAPRRTAKIQWTKQLPTKDVYETFLVVTKVRFSDGTVWAPTEELIVVP